MTTPRSDAVDPRDVLGHPVAGSDLEFEERGRATYARMPSSMDEPLRGQRDLFGGSGSDGDAEVYGLRRSLEVTQAAAADGMLDELSPGGPRRGLMPANHHSFHEPESRSSAELKKELEQALLADNPFKMGA